MSTALSINLNLCEFGFKDRFAATLPLHGVTALFGPSGSGKTRIMRAIAGLDRLPGSSVQIGTDQWQSDTVFTPPHQRDIAYVFQEPSLLPHLSVGENIEFARKRVRRSKPNSIDQVELFDLLNINHLLHRSSNAISVGEQQRVAIARALTAQPSLLLMDEPLSALDEGHKTEILPLLERMCSVCNTPILYVTHSRDELMRLADEVIFIQQGKNIASGRVEEVLPRLESPFIQGEQIGTVIRGKVASYDEECGLICVSSSIGELYTAGKLHYALGSQVRLKLEARDISIALSKAKDSSILNLVEATVLDFRAVDNAHTMLKLRANSQEFLAKITKLSFQNLQIKQGLSVYAQIKSVAFI